MKVKLLKKFRKETHNKFRVVRRYNNFLANYCFIVEAKVEKMDSQGNTHSEWETVKLHSNKTEAFIQYNQLRFEYMHNLIFKWGMKHNHAKVVLTMQ